MRLKNNIILGIDTSCYTTSIAAINLDKNFILSKKTMLKVKDGTRGLRQSDGFFQHVNNLGDLFEDIKNDIKDFNIKGICVSSKPRSVENSYMPVFYSGYKFGKAISSVLNVPLYETSHQDGHIEAAYFDTKINKNKFICVHMSGGTTEILLVNRLIDKYNLNIIGGTKDISVGQLIDRIGVKLGMPFPCGIYLDEESLKYSEKIEKIGISSKDGYMNFSGIETKLYNMIDTYPREYICSITFKCISDSLLKAILYLCEKHDIKDVLFVGGVSSSKYISKNLGFNLKNKNINSYWTKSEYAKDNAIGVSLIGINRFLGGI